jgi:hypothetical protein
MLKSLKTTVVEDVITTEEVLVVDLVVEEVLLQEEKEVLLQDAKVLVVDSEVTETQLQEKVVLDQEVHLRQEEKVVFHLKERQEKVLQTERQDVLKALVLMHQDQEDQEETNTICIATINLPNIREIFFYNNTIPLL